MANQPVAVKADSTLLRDCWSYLLWNALIVVPWIFGGFRAPVWVSLLLVFLLIVVIMSVRWALQGEACRQAAVRTADEYRRAWPVRSFAAAAAVANLPSSCAVTQRLEWSAYRFRTALTFIAVAAWLDLFWPAQASGYLFLGVCVALTLVCSLYQTLSWFQQAMADEEGLTVRTAYRRQRMPWKDARLFAIAATARHGDNPNVYELSSATQILRWRREPKFNPLDERSTTGPEEMDVLLALIHVRTGLPLLDLRRPVPHATFSPDFTRSQHQ